MSDFPTRPELGGIQDEGIDLALCSKINFVGAGITASAAGGICTVTVSAGAGGVTSVSASSPLQSSGGTTPDISFANQAQYAVLSGPTGGSGAPTFMGLTAGHMPATVPTVTFGAAGDLLFSTAGSGACTALPDVSAGSYLRSGGVAAAPLWSTLKLPNTATTGDVLYASAANTIGNLAAVATGQVLASAGVGTAPAYTTTPVLAGVAGNAAPVALVGGAQTEATTAYGATSDTPAAWTTTGRIHGFKNNGTVKGYVREDSSAIVHYASTTAAAQLTASDGTFVRASSAIIYLGPSGTIAYQVAPTYFIPQSQSTVDLGIDGQSFKRLRLSGTAHVAGDYAASAGWGTTASIGTVSANDSHGSFIVTSAGTGQGANPTVTLTFKQGTWTTAPRVQAWMEGGGTGVLTFITSTSTATTAVFTYQGTPVATFTYQIAFRVVGV